MKYLIACDLDGTLLNKNHEISQETQMILRQLAHDGHMVVITTGRPHHAAIHYYNQLDLDMPFITDNGGSIEHPRNPNFKPVRESIPLDIFHNLFTQVEPILSSAVYTSNGVAYAYKYQRELEWLFSGAYAYKLIEKDFRDLEVSPCGVVFLVENKHNTNLEQILDNEFSEHLNYRYWGNDDIYSVYEVYLKHLSKAKALDFLLQYYGLKKDQLIAIGDGINDVEMIGFASVGVAMKNAVDEVKQVADYETHHDHDNHGAALFFKDFFHIK